MKILSRSPNLRNIVKVLLISKRGTLCLLGVTYIMILKSQLLVKGITQFKNKLKVLPIYNFIHLIQFNKE